LKIVIPLFSRSISNGSAIFFKDRKIENNAKGEQIQVRIFIKKRLSFVVTTYNIGFTINQNPKDTNDVVNSSGDNFVISIF
jgi:hypothetical protein